MSVANVQQHYYRFKRKTGSSTKSVASSARNRAQKTALGAVTAAQSVAQNTVGPQLEQLGRGLGNIRKDVTGDVTQISADVVQAFMELLDEARKNEHFRKLEKNLTQLLSR